jgi:hypothetical protein
LSIATPSGRQIDQLELLILIEEQFSGADLSEAAVEQIEVVGDLIRGTWRSIVCWEIYTRRHFIAPATSDGGSIVRAALQY